MFASNPYLSNVTVRGELFSCRKVQSGHIYFGLKDPKGMVKGVMFRLSASGLTFEPKDGMEVICTGRIGIYSERGEYQLYAEDMQPGGTGAAALALAQLRAKLEEEGLFQESRKRSLPLLPRKIGIITSVKGAALGDILNIMSRRFPRFSAIIFDSRVQGAEAAETIIKGFMDANENQEIDVIILARGGGSKEDLEVFNDEGVVRAIFASRIPVITGIGHEMDFTLSDLVSDKRAPTPSGAAELVLPTEEELRDRIRACSRNIVAGISGKLKLLRNNLERGSFSKASDSFKNRLSQSRLKILAFEENIQDNQEKRLVHAKNLLLAQMGRLSALDPMAIMSRGYNISLDQDYGKLEEKPKLGQKFISIFPDGGIMAQAVEEIDEKDQKFRRKFQSFLRRRDGHLRKHSQ